MIKKSKKPELVRTMFGICHLTQIPYYITGGLNTQVACYFFQFHIWNFGSLNYKAASLYYSLVSNIRTATLVKSSSNMVGNHTGYS